MNDVRTETPGSAPEIDKARGAKGSIWEKERFDRYVRSDRDLEEKFRYTLRNRWDPGVAQTHEDYLWVWTPEDEFRDARSSSRPKSATSTRDACATRSSHVTL